MTENIQKIDIVSDKTKDGLLDKMQDKLENQWIPMGDVKFAQEEYFVTFVRLKEDDEFSHVSDHLKSDGGYFE